MTGGGGDDEPPLANGGDFLLQLLRKPPPQPQTPPQPPPTSSTATRASPPTPSPPPPQTLTHDPAVAAVGPTLPFPPLPSNGHDLLYPPPWLHCTPFAPHNFFLPPQNPSPNWSPSPPPGFNHSHHLQYLQSNHQFFRDDMQKLGFFGTSPRSNSVHQQESNLIFGSLPCRIQNNGGVSHDNSYDNSAPGANTEGLLSKEREMGLGNRRLNGLEMDFQNFHDLNRNPLEISHTFQNHEQERGGSGHGGWGRQQHGGNYRSVAPSSAVRRPPPGFASKPKSVGHSDSGNRRRSFEHNVDREKGHFGELNHRSSTSNIEDERHRILSHEHKKAHGDTLDGLGLTGQLDCPGPPAGSNLHDIEESQLALHGEIGEDGEKPRHWRQDRMRRDGGRGHLEVDDSGEHLMGSSVLEDEFDDKNEKRLHHSSRDKMDFPIDSYTNLLLSDHDDVYEVSPAPSRKTTRTKNFSPQEDVIIVSAWLNTSKDPITGSEQSSGTFWKRIFEYFVENENFGVERSLSSVKSHLSNKRVKHFEFSSPGESSPATPNLGDDSEESSSNPSSNPSPNLNRPLGRKAAKKQAKDKKKQYDVEDAINLQHWEEKIELDKQKAARYERRLAQQEIIIAQHQAQLELQQEQLELQIMQTDTTNMDPVSADYWNNRKREVLAKRGFNL